jgi:predicted Zn-dependent protease
MNHCKLYAGCIVSRMLAADQVSNSVLSVDKSSPLALGLQNLQSTSQGSFMPFKVSLFSFIFAVAVGCTTSPTGRRQLQLLPDSQVRNMGSSAFTEMKASMPVSKDELLNSYVKCITGAVTAEMPKQEKWETVVFVNDEPNAFALPGGKIGVHTGMLKVARTPSQLAAVLGHEVAHVTVGHINERVSEELLLQGGLALASVVLTDRTKPSYQMTMAALGLGAQFGVILPHSRRQERESDLVGLQYMAKAGFDPKGAVELWENMKKLGGAQPPEFMSTHPAHGTRIEDLKEALPEAMKLYAKTDKNAQCRLPRNISSAVNPRILVREYAN